MSLFLFHGPPSTSSSTSSRCLKISCNFTRLPSQLPIKRNFISASITPARDRIIDFGKHRGRMLGTLPSKYLKWVSENLRARDFEEWAKLADEVLQDPVYKDRLEWEFAENILTGDHGSRADSSVEELLEFSERFGWDNYDKLGWSRIDFSLLGTSKGGRIPRKGSSKKGNFESLSEKSKILEGRKKKLGFRKEGEEFGSLRGKREVRIERQRLKRGSDLHNLEEKCHFEVQEKNVNNTSNHNPFPGREALLKKVFHSRRVL